MRKGDTVLLTVSNGLSTTQMPDLTGMTYQEAASRLKELGNQSIINRVISDDIPDSVISQEPSPQETITHDTVITLTVSGGKIYVPNLAGRTLAEAEELLEQEGLAIRPVLSYIDTTEIAESGLVSGQTPEAETYVMQNTEVAVSVCHYPDDRSKSIVEVEIPESTETVDFIITLQPEEKDIEYQVMEVQYPAGRAMKDLVQIYLPDYRNYFLRVYRNNEMVWMSNVRWSD